MTVVAWDGTTLACDSRATVGFDILPVHEPKIYTHQTYPNVYIAGAGNARDIVSFVDAYFSGERGVLKKAYVLIIDNGKAEFLCPGDRVGSFIKPPYAFGSGGHVAWGAMLAGAPAKLACRLACKVDSGCGLPIKSYTV